MCLYKDFLGTRTRTRTMTSQVKNTLVFVPPIAPRLPAGGGKLVHPGGVIDPTKIKTLAKKFSSTPNDAAVLHLLRITPLDYKPQAIARVNVLAYGAGIGHDQFVGDGEMAYKSAVAYLVTTNEAYALKTVAILDAWAKICVYFEGSNAPLEAAWGTAAMARAAELLKYTWPGWDRSGVEKRYIAWVDKFIMKHLVKPLGWDDRNNWGLSICEARLILSILREGTVTATYDWSKEFLWCQYQYQRIHSGYVMATGQTGESTRDLAHAQFGLGSLIQIPEIVWHQGIDLYSFRDSLMHRSMEFHGQIMLGQIPEKMTAGPIKDLTFLPCGWRIARNHYVNRKGYTMPFVDTLLKKRPYDVMTFHWGLGNFI